MSKKCILTLQQIAITHHIKKNSRKSNNVEQTQSNFIEITLWHGCSPVNLVHIFRTSLSKNTSGWLLLNLLARASPNENVSGITLVILALVQSVLLISKEPSSTNEVCQKILNSF